MKVRIPECLCGAESQAIFKWDEVKQVKGSTPIMTPPDYFCYNCYRAKLRSYKKAGLLCSSD